MAPPLIRLSGDEGLAARYLRGAKQLLLKVQAIRALADVPTFALTRDTDEFKISATSSGTVDIITIDVRPAPSPGEQVVKKVGRGRSGIIFQFKAVRGFTTYNRGIVALANADLARYDNYIVEDEVWNGYGKKNLASTFPLMSPPDIDESQASFSDAIIYAPSVDLHVSVQIQGIFVGGGQILRTTTCRFVGARLYPDGTLGIAYLTNARTDLCVEFIDANALTTHPLPDYATNFVAAATVDISTVAHVGLVGSDNMIFHFHPKRFEGTWLNVIYGNAGSGLTAEGDTVDNRSLSYQYGKYVVNNDLSAAFTIEASALDVIYAKTKTFVNGGSTNVVVVHVNNSGTGVGTQVHTTVGDYTFDQNGSIEVVIPPVPIWTGYTAEGTRLVWRISGTLSATSAGTNSIHFSLDQSGVSDGSAPNPTVALTKSVVTRSHTGSTNIQMCRYDQEGNEVPYRVVPSLVYSGTDSVRQKQVFGMGDGRYVVATQFSENTRAPVSGGVSVGTSTEVNVSSSGVPATSSTTHAGSATFFFADAGPDVAYAGIPEQFNETISSGASLDSDSGLAVYASEPNTGTETLYRIFSAAGASSEAVQAYLHVVGHTLPAAQFPVKFPNVNLEVNTSAATRTTTITGPINPGYTLVVQPDLNLTAIGNRLAEGAVWDGALKKHAVCPFGHFGSSDPDMYRVWLVGDKDGLTPLVPDLLKSKRDPNNTGQVPWSPNGGANPSTDDLFNPAGLI